MVMHIFILLLVSCFQTLCAADENTTHFFSCVRFDPIEKIDLLLQQHPEWLEATNSDGQTPLLVAVKLARKEVATFLLDKGARINVRDRHNFSAFHYATECAQTQALCGLLIEKGADPSYCCPQKTPLIAAITNNKYELTHQLLHAGKPGSLVAQEGEQALAHAAIINRLEIAKLLMKHGTVYDSGLIPDTCITNEMKEILQTTKRNVKTILPKNPITYLRDREAGNRRNRIIESFKLSQRKK